MRNARWRVCMPINTWQDSATYLGFDALLCDLCVMLSHGDYGDYLKGGDC